MKLHGSARKHFKRDRLTEAGVLRAVEQPTYRAALDDEDDPRRWLLLGFDDAGRMLELVILVFDSGEALVIHAMKARAQYLDLLL
ncbi:hypothetical protein APR04_003592 [Promicromonospora umidemergens]|uniref:Toxin n=1 Tax=Promicromonospora umidemergens TaxID=629679 RepID=A0ABP8YAH0_9MICO|nr:toxin [Promicromonospora umidemergens]MCP2284669.1 hypothetical protein [Promicromonospora umidemergens]